MLRGEFPQDYRTLGRPICMDFVGQRVDQYLSHNFKFRSRNQWQACIAEGGVVINGLKLKRSSGRLRLGDEVFYHSPEGSEPDVDRGIEAVWRDGGIMAVYKPHNLPMHEGGAYRVNTFAEVVHQQFGSEWAAVHRLDRETSGLVLCANTPELRADLCAYLRDRDMEKTYLAIAMGQVEAQSWAVDQPIGDLTDTLLRQKKGVCADGLPSFTTFRVLESAGDFHLCEVKPKTGRTHQIRIHSTFSGLPLVGDSKHYPDETIFLELAERGFTPRVKSALKFERLCLHAKSLNFIHPITKEKVFIDCPLPLDMKRIWDHFVKDAL